MNITLSQLEMMRNKYSSIWDHKFEQQVERVRPYTTVLPAVSRKYYEFPIGETNVHEDERTRGTIVMQRSIFDRKFSNDIPLSIGEVKDMGDLDNTFSHIMDEQVSAAARFYDMVALGVFKDTDGKYKIKPKSSEGAVGGILGTNYGGENGRDTYELDLTINGYKNRTGNLVPVDFKSTGTGVKKNLAGTFLDRLFYVKQLLEEKDVFDGTEKGAICVAISPTVKRMLTLYESCVNSDYGFRRLDAAGSTTYINSLNINIVVTNMLPLMDTETTKGEAVPGARMCAVWLRSRIGFGTWKETEFTLKDVNNLVDVDHCVRIRGRIGCGRKDEDTVFVLPEVEMESSPLD